MGVLKKMLSDDPYLENWEIELYKDLTWRLQSKGISEDKIYSNGYFYKFDTEELYVHFCVQPFDNGLGRFVGSACDINLRKLEEDNEISDKFNGLRISKDPKKWEELTRKHNYRKICEYGDSSLEIFDKMWDILKKPLDEYINEKLEEERKTKELIAEVLKKRYH